VVRFLDEVFLELGDIMTPAGTVLA
jgi:hypothetical protein